MSSRRARRAGRKREARTSLASANRHSDAVKNAPGAAPPRSEHLCLAAIGISSTRFEDDRSVARFLAGRGQERGV